MGSEHDGVGGGGWRGDVVTKIIRFSPFDFSTSTRLQNRLPLPLLPPPLRLRCACHK